MQITNTSNLLDQLNESYDRNPEERAGIEKAMKLIHQEQKPTPTEEELINNIATQLGTIIDCKKCPAKTLGYFCRNYCSKNMQDYINSISNK